MDNIFSPDIYKISEVINNIQKKYMEDVSEETLTMGMYGYTNEVFSTSIQNSITMAAEYGNEALPIRAKFEKTILTNAIAYNIEDINAIPSQMDIMIGFIEKELELQLENNIFRLDRNCKLDIGGYEFHLDYDIIITRERLSNGDFVYAARYDIGRTNVLSDVTNPYLPPPILLNITSNSFVFISCTVRQVQASKVYRKVITNSILDNKTFEFEYEDQLASFDVLVMEGDKKTYLTPIFEGMPLNGKEKYCFYTFINSNTIRVKFDRNSYEPKINCNIEIDLKTTKGSKGNFNYKDDVINGLESENQNYRNLSVLIKPITNSRYGIDRKSVEVLKEIIPKEILARGTIANNKDLENYFNNLEDSRLLFFRRRDNQIERLYYAYLLVRDNMNNIIPTNTIDLVVQEKDFNIKKDNRFMLNPGNKIKYENNIGIVDNTIPESEVHDKEVSGFLYGSPFMCVVNKNPLSVSYYLNNVNKDYYFKFSYINKNSSLQFISTYLNCKRNYLEDNNYKITMRAVQNINIDRSLVETDNYGNVIRCDIKPILVINTTNYKYYTYGKVVRMNMDSFTYDIEFELETDNTINVNNQIKINNLYMRNSTSKSHVYLNDSIDMSIYMVAKFDEEYGRDNLDTIVPGLQGYTLCNKYDTVEKVSLFYNYSHIMKSTVTIQNFDRDGYTFKIKGVPLVRYSYLNDAERCMSFIDYINYRKVYIDDALKVLEDSFSVDFKFFNTYGPSKMFKIGHNDEILDKVNLTFKFKIKLLVGASKYAIDNITQEIKNYIENLNEITSIHIVNLTTHLSNKFKTDLDFIEFLGINNYNALYQYLKKVDTEILEDVPEFVNINLTQDLNPDINIILV